MLMLHKGCQPVTRKELAGVPIPEATRTHRPVAHGVLADTVVGVATRLGLTVRREQWGLARDGMRLYGALDFDSPNGLMPDGIGPSLGIRHANDKTLSVQLTAGARVLVCDNGVLIGEIETLKRKHTPALHLEQLIEDGINEYIDKLPNFRRWRDDMVSSHLHAWRAKILLHDAFMVHRVMKPSYFAAVSDRYFRSKEHREQFPGRNRWTLYNAFTETFKSESVALQTRSFYALDRALSPVRN